MRLVVDAQLDPYEPPHERKRGLEKVARKIEYIQTRRRLAAQSHRKRRLRRLRELGIRISRLRRCFNVF